MPPHHRSHLPSQTGPRGAPHPLFPPPVPPEHTPRETHAPAAAGSAEGQFSPNGILRCHFIVLRQRDAPRVLIITVCNLIWVTPIPEEGALLRRGATRTRKDNDPEAVNEDLSEEAGAGEGQQLGDANLCWLL